MKCVIPSVNLKIFGKAIQSLTKIGDEISIEPTLDGLHLKSVNSTRSCMAFFDFKPRFFQQYDDGSPRPVEQNFAPRFRLPSKSCLNIFKSLNSMDKLVESCQICLNDTQSRVVFSLHCKHGLAKNYNLTYMEADPLNCSLSKGACSNTVKAESKLYTEILASFPNSLEEMTMMVKSGSMTLRNYVDGELADPLKNFSTTMTLDRQEFESYDIETETSISFCLKEVRAALSFAEYNDYSTSLHFDEAGMPMFVSIDADPSLEMTFIVSTISEDLTQSSSASNQAVSTGSCKGKLYPQSTAVSASQDIRAMLNKPTRSTGDPIKPAPTLPAAHSSKSRATKASHSVSATVQNITSDSMVKVEPKLNSLMNDTSISLLNPNDTVTKPKSSVDELLKEIDSDVWSPDPPAKKAKSMFFGKKPASKPQSSTQRYLDEILAEDSDE
ncbi:cell cycle checkpoint control protein RAD9A-like [Watersipora subatra]|uniref:cell cycle checkpoint control protein RAD9A-like n=1 Tax=Watersipora subatra TaxID=2589382 RepID=UPI00355C46F6